MKLVFFILLVTICVPDGNGLFRRIKQDYDLEAPELIRRHGYPVQTHTVTTEDGYILTLHRIACSPKNSTCSNRPVVFITHTMWCSSSCWLLLGPNKSLPYLLADQGYDVWLGNFRGNKYSKRHKTLHPSQAKFWDFSWHEMGQYDLPASIDYMLKETGRKDIYYIGHSTGSTAFFVMTSLTPEYNSKIRLMIAVAPLAYVSGVHHSWFRLSALAETGPAADSMYNQEVFPVSPLRNAIIQSQCKDGSTLQEACVFFVLFYGGLDFSQLNRTMLPLILSNFPAGSSLKTWIHYGQLQQSSKFRQYDHGTWTNMKTYSTPEPPDYDLTKADVPIYLLYSENDIISIESDTDRLRSALPNVVASKAVSDALFSHLDFVWGNDVKTIAYNNIIKFINKF